MYVRAKLDGTGKLLHRRCEQDVSPVMQVSMYAATVEDNALIGIGATLLEGSKACICRISCTLQHATHLTCSNSTHPHRHHGHGLCSMLLGHLHYVVYGYNHINMTTVR